MSAHPPATHPELSTQAQALMPPVARELLAVLGQADALALLRQRPGCAQWVPKKPNDSNELAHILSGPGFAALCRHYGDTYLKLPNCAALARGLRNAALVADYTAGLGRNALCMKYGMTVRSVEKILGQPTVIAPGMNAVGKAAGVPAQAGLF